jgi:hypothetical protein
MSVVGSSEVAAVAAEARERLLRAVESLGAG